MSGAERVVEAEPFHITNQHSDVAPAERWNGDSRAPAYERTRMPVRFGLQRRAQTNFRRYLVRDLRRLVVLVLADLSSFYVMRELVRAVRDQAVLGDFLSGELRQLIPPGILNGWQYAAALFV